MSFPRWQVHRGFWQGGIRENTLLAFAEAKKRGAEMVELDVQLSREGVPHVFHDFRLNRFFHVDKAVAAVSSEDLDGLNIPTLKTIIDSPEVPSYLNIELKSKSIVARKIADRVASVIQASQTNPKKILISSFNPMALFWMKRLMPKLPRGLIVGDPQTLLSPKFPWWIRLAEPQYLNVHFQLIDEESCRDRLLSFQKHIMVWTVNDRAKADFYLKRGASSIISDLCPEG